jgi:hypothetical protein
MPTIICVECGASHEAKHKDCKYCSGRCRTAHFRAAKASKSDSRLRFLARKAPRAAAKIEKMRQAHGEGCIGDAIDAAIEAVEELWPLRAAAEVKRNGKAEGVPMS